MPKYGSLYTPFSTRTANTVFGSDVLYQLEESKPDVETSSALALTFAEDCTAHPSRNVIPSSACETGAAIVSVARSAATRLKPANKPLPSLAIRAMHREKKFSFLPCGIIMISVATPNEQWHLNRFNRANILGLTNRRQRALV